MYHAPGQDGISIESCGGTPEQLAGARMLIDLYGEAQARAALLRHLPESRVNAILVQLQAPNN